MWSRPVAAGAACLALFALSVPAYADTATADLIPDPPDSTWQAAPDQTGPKTLDDIYGSHAGAVKGFVDAYVKAWSQAPAQGLVDRLERFSSVFWAAFRLGQSEGSDKANQSNTSYHTVPGFGNGAYEITYGPDAQGFLADAFVFTQGDYVAAIAVVSKSTPDHGAVMAQANRQLATIPIPVGEYNSIGQGFSIGVAVIAAAAGALALIVGGIVLAIVLSRRRRVQAPTGLSLSPDRRYWWDGQSWQDTAARMPPGAALSPDGTQWWDGIAWRPRPPTG